MKKTSTLILSALALTSLVATAQEAQPQPGDRGDRGGRRGDFNPEEFRQRMTERLKGALKATDEEWTVLQPLIEKVSTKQREAMGARFGGFGRGGGDRGPGGQGGGNTSGGGDRGPGRGGSPESQALRDALENESTSPDDLKAKLTAVREQRKKAQAELEAARKELQAVVSVRQEAVLVSMGMLE